MKLKTHAVFCLQISFFTFFLILVNGNSGPKPGCHSGRAMANPPAHLANGSGFTLRYVQNPNTSHHLLWNHPGSSYYQPALRLRRWPAKCPLLRPSPCSCHAQRNRWGEIVSLCSKPNKVFPLLQSTGQSHTMMACQVRQGSTIRYFSDPCR